MSKVMQRSQFGNPILRETAAILTKKQIASKETKQLITDMRYTLNKKHYGIGLSVPQVGRGIVISVTEIKPTKLRPNLPKSKWASLVVINPKIIKVYGSRKQVYEGCISFAGVFAKVPRYKKIRLRYLDEKGTSHEKDFKDLLAHVLQHEIDHLNGVLFVDKVKDPKTYITLSEYRKYIVNKEKLEK